MLRVLYGYVRQSVIEGWFDYGIMPTPSA
jgi:hypothetical protein